MSGALSLLADEDAERAVALVLGGCATPPDAPDGLDAFLGRDSLTLTEAFASERFPNVVVTNAGTVLATFGTKSVRARRSTDGGATWGEEIVIADPGFHGGGTTVDQPCKGLQPKPGNR